MLHVNREIHYQSRDVENELEADDETKLLHARFAYRFTCFVTHAIT